MSNESRNWPHRQCANPAPHPGHVHVNGAGSGCGLPEWCPGIRATGGTP